MHNTMNDLFRNFESSISVLRSNSLYQSDVTYKEMLDDCIVFYDKLRYSKVINKPAVTRERENQDLRFYVTLCLLLREMVESCQGSERLQKSQIRRIAKWWKENRTVLHSQSSVIENLNNANGQVRVSQSTIERVKELEEADEVLASPKFFKELSPSEEIAGEKGKNEETDENETEPMTAKSNEMELSEQLHASLLDLPEVPDLDAEKEEVDGEISVETPASANLSYSYKDAREVLIPGASKSFLVTMPRAAPLEQSPLRNTRGQHLSARVNFGSMTTPKIEEYLDPAGRRAPGDLWTQFLENQKNQEEFATLSEFYGRHGTAYTKRYSAHARSWGPEDSTQCVIDSYAKCFKSPATVLPPSSVTKVKQKILEQNLGDFQEFENQLADNRRLAKSAHSVSRRWTFCSKSEQSARKQKTSISKPLTAYTSRSARREQQNVDEEAKAMQIQRSYKSFTMSRPQGTPKTAGAASTPLPIDAQSSERSKLAALELVQSIDQACNELVLNKEQVGPEPFPGFRQPFMRINPFKTIASQTITLTTKRPATAVDFDAPILLIPGLSAATKRKDPEETTTVRDLMAPRLMPGQKQLLQSAGGSTSRGNRPYTCAPKVNAKDKWANHQPSDENDRVKAAANHPFYSFNRNVMEKMFLVNHLGKQRSAPWRKEAYRITPTDITQYYEESLGKFQKKPILQPAVSFVPNIASKKEFVTWAM